MKHILMIAAMKYSESDGISKKICLQAKGLSCDNDQCTLFCLTDTGIILLEYINEQLVRKELCDTFCNRNEGIGGISHEKILLNNVYQYISRNQVDDIYVRHMLPCVNLIKVLACAKKKNVRTMYEIPTYPYYWEQYNISNNKLRTIIKLGLETLYWPLIYLYINVLCVVVCNSKTKKMKKMLSIPNGYSGEKQEYIIRDCENLVMIGVGTIYSYHGYQKIIDDMKLCNCRFGSDKKIYFHIVGESEEITRLMKYVEKIGLCDNVIFHGKKYGDELKKIYLDCNLGIGTMQLSLRKADIDTAIKNIEYMAFGLPVITSGQIFEIPEKYGIYIKQCENEVIDYETLYDFVLDFYVGKETNNIIDNILADFSWSNIMRMAKRRG